LNEVELRSELERMRHQLIEKDGENCMFKCITATTKEMKTKTAMIELQHIMDTKTKERIDLQVELYKRSKEKRETKHAKQQKKEDEEKSEGVLWMIRDFENNLNPLERYTNLYPRRLLM
jgi:hypothetical protein